MPHLNHYFKRLLHPLTIVSIVVLVAILFEYCDLYIENQLRSLNFREHAALLRQLTQIGSGYLLIPFLIAALWFRYGKTNPIWEERAWFISACIVFTGVACWVLKFLFGRSRPDLWHDAHEYGFYWLQIKSIYWSFPSGHATTIFSAAFALSFLFPRYCLALISGGLLIALTRVLLGHHYLSDVFAASYFTLLEVLALIYFLNKKEHLSTLWSKPTKADPDLLQNP